MAMAPSAATTKKKPVFSGTAPNKDFPVASGAKLKEAKLTSMVAVEKKYPTPGTPNQVKSMQRREQAAIRPKASAAPAMPAPTNSESAGAKPLKPAPSSNYSGGTTSAAPASSTADPKFNSSSAKPPAYVAPVAGTKRGGVETRYNRDSGLAMDSRKRK